MKKFLLIIFVLSFCLSGCDNNENTSNNEDSNTYNYTASRTTTLDNSNYNDDYNNTNDDINTERDLSSFSTKIYTPNDKARQNNIQITCSKLNGTIVKPRRNIFFLQYSRKSHL